MSKELLEQNIAKAQLETDRKKDIVKKGKMRQRYHFMPQTGWLNDPNGLIYFRGKYHFFFQWNPYSGFWDSMHWGHAVSDDMLHWEYLPLALAPSETYDDYPKGGCFSGSAIEYDGKLFLMYTGTANTGKGVEQTQCIAYSEDGIHFEKYAGNPVITAPEGISVDCFRDSKVWRHEDTFYMVCGASRNKRGLALLYKSEDMLHWTSSGAQPVIIHVVSGKGNYISNNHIVASTEKAGMETELSDSCFSAQVNALTNTDKLVKLDVTAVRIEKESVQNIILDSGSDKQVVLDRKANAFRATPVPEEMNESF